MIRTSPATYYRAAAAFAAAAVLSFTTRQASAQQTVDLFAGTLSSPATLTLGGTTPNTTSGTNTGFGPGYTGTLSATLSVNNTLSEGFAPNGTSNTFTIAETGTTNAISNTSASKLFGTSLSPGATYALTLTRTAGFTVGLLNNVNIQLFAGTTQFVDTSSGEGLLGIVDVLGRFGSSNTESFQFTVPSGVTGALTATINSSELANVLGGSYTFQSATITQVPEPRTVVAMLLGAAGLVTIRCRRRLQAA